jgi:hypothetical protein
MYLLEHLRPLRFLISALCLFLTPKIDAATILQAAGATSVAFEGESYLKLINSGVTTWTVTNEVAASGGSALFIDGINNTTLPALSYAVYAIKFATAGDYSVYYRWRADKGHTDLDPNSANSFWMPNTLGDVDSAAFVGASVNNAVQVPAANSYNVFKDSAVFTVTQEQVEAGVPLIFKIGTREAGLFMDRFLFSQNAALTTADFNAQQNSDSDVIVQGGDNYVAFEAEGKVTLLNSGVTTWTVTNEVAASGGAALFIAGINNTTLPALSYAEYSIKFTSAGDYSVYYRWRADKDHTDLDPNSANSFWMPSTLGDVDATAFAGASVNNAVQVPAANSYNVFKDATVFTVTQAQVDAGIPIIFKTGTREAGLFMDRFIFSQNNALTSADFNALPNSGSDSVGPKLVKAIGSATLTDVRVSFTKPLRADSIAIADFTLSGGITITAATLDTETSKDVVLTTSAQTQGALYTITVKNVADLAGNLIAANSSTNYHAWKLTPGWVKREFYFGITGATVADLAASPKFPSSPDQVDFVRSFLINNAPAGADYGVRLTAIFTPVASGDYEFYMHSDDEAQFSISSDQTADNLFPLLTTPCCGGVFTIDQMVVAPGLQAGQNYLLEVLLKQGGGEVHLGLAARLAGSTSDPVTLPDLGGTAVATFINPDGANLSIIRQPADATAAAGARATFSAGVNSSASPIYFQWQRNNVDIAGANYATYITPVLTPADNAAIYRVIVSVGGNSFNSGNAKLTVAGTEISDEQPYIGINFVGAYTAIAGGTLAPTDVTGVVPQENFNNISGFTATDAALVDASGAPTPVLLNFTGAGTSITGSGFSDALHVLYQGYVHNTDTNLDLILSDVPTGTYDLILYTAGFNFNATYEEGITVTGAEVSPTLHIVAQHGGEFTGTFVRASSTNENARDKGNYVEFDDLHPAADGTITLSVVPETPAERLGVINFPAVNGIQLLKVVAHAVTPKLSLGAISGNNLKINWGTDAVGFIFESSATINAGWTAVTGTSNPIAAAGSASVTTSGSAQFYRLRKP